MRLLVLGGTALLGRAVARHARDAGHEVTCLARGAAGEPPAGIRFVTADRDRPGGLVAVAGDTFDAVIDVTRRPSHARRAVTALAGRIGHWTYVSTISVYADLATPGQLAGVTPLLPPAPPEVDDPAGDPERYGPCKVACEQAVRGGVEADRLFICRAGLIVGPEDGSGRFSYWVERLARGGRVLAPGDPEDRVQLIDVRDLAAWLVLAAQTRVTGVYDAASAPMPRGDVLAQIAAGVGTEPSVTWADQQFLRAHEVAPWAGPRSLPLWVPLPETAGLLTRDTRPALAAGLTIRPVAETAAATLEWLNQPGSPAPVALSAGDEAALLHAWDTRRTS
jgi:nucleoside-diphosphate-sugar epimerase